jgi:hypothetical protein
LVTKIFYCNYFLSLAFIISSRSTCSLLLSLSSLFQQSHSLVSPYCADFVALPKSSRCCRPLALRASFEERDVSDVDFHLLKSMHFHHLYSHYNPKRYSGFSFIIESRWRNMAGTVFSIEAGRWGEMVKSVSSFLCAQIKSTLHFCLPPHFRKQWPLLTHDCKHKVLHRYLGLQY